MFLPRNGPAGNGGGGRPLGGKRIRKRGLARSSRAEAHSEMDSHAESGAECRVASKAVIPICRASRIVPGHAPKNHSEGRSPQRAKEAHGVFFRMFPGETCARFACNFL